MLGRWGVGPGDRVVLYDDVCLNRHVIRGLWLLRLYGWPRGRVHVLDGGLPTCREDGPLTTDVGRRGAPSEPLVVVLTRNCGDSTIFYADDRETGRTVWSAPSDGSLGPFRPTDKARESHHSALGPTSVVSRMA